MVRHWHWLAGLLLVVPASRAHGAVDEILVLSQPCPSISCAALADALRIRLPRVAVRLVPAVPDGSTAARIELVDGDPVRVRMVSGARVLLDAPVPAAADDGARRAALFAAIAFEAAPPEPPPPPAPAASVTVEAPRAAPAPARWAVAAGVGPSVALGDDSADAAPVLHLRLDWYFNASGAVEAGAKLSGNYHAGTGMNRVTVVDRALWLGAAYRVAWGALAVGFGCGMQYTFPSLSAEDPAMAAMIDEAPLSRFALRASAYLTWTVHDHLALAVGAAAAFALDERELMPSSPDGVDLGSVGIDVVAGPEVRW